MTDRNKFEEMLERLVNEDRAGAEELFHEIVVEKSREIYQSIIESEEEEEVDEAAEEDDEELDEAAEEEEEVDEAAEEDDEELDEMFGLEDFAPEADNNPMGMGGDADDDMLGDIGMDGDDMDDMGDEEGDTDSRLADLEDALDELKAEFDALMSGEEGDDMDDMGDEEGDDMDDMGDEEGDDEGDEEKESFAFEAKKDAKKDDKKKKSAGEEMREYVEKIAPAKMGDNGANAKSIVAKPNNMGGTTANLRGGESKSEGTQGGLLNPAKKDMSTGNINVPGGKAGKTAFKKSEPGHGAEKKGAGETADKSAGSMLNGAPKRAK
jgi:hypothetical protein